MKLILNRILKGNDYTIGELYANDEYVCDTLEDRVRELPATCPYTPKGLACKCEEKVYGYTAIPAGTYKVVLSMSPKFKKVTPEILDVPHFLGIRIHSANKSDEVEGCIAVGTWDETKGDWVSDSRKAFNKIMELLQPVSDAGEEITIEINN